LVVSTGTRPAQIGTYPRISRQIAKFAAFAPLRVKPMPCGHRKSVDQNQGLLIWRADLAENKEAKVCRRVRSGGANRAAKPEFVGFRR